MPHTRVTPVTPPFAVRRARGRRPPRRRRHVTLVVVAEPAASRYFADASTPSLNRPFAHAGLPRRRRHLVLPPPSPSPFVHYHVCLSRHYHADAVHFTIFRHHNVTITN